MLIAGWGVAADTLRATGPMLIFLTSALTIASLAERAGLAGWAGAALSRASHGRPRRLYALVCLSSAALTCIVSLDRAVVLMVPLVNALSRRCRVARAPLFLGAVGVANAVSLSVPEGNPTNLVVMSRLGLSTSAFLEHLLVPGLCAGVLCALVPLRRLARESRVDTLVVNAAPIFVPWRIGAQMAGLVAALDRLAPVVSLRGGGLVTLLAVAAGTAMASAVANNLPVSASVAAFASAGPGAYAALIGLSVGALATAHGSVATLIARDLAGEHRPWARMWVPPAAAAVALSTLVFWALS